MQESTAKKEQRNVRHVQQVLIHLLDLGDVMYALQEQFVGWERLRQCVKYVLTASTLRKVPLFVRCAHPGSFQSPEADHVRPVRKESFPIPVSLQIP